MLSTLFKVKSKKEEKMKKEKAVEKIEDLEQLLSETVKISTVVDKDNAPYMAFSNPELTEFRGAAIALGGSDGQTRVCPLEWDLKSVAAEIVGEPEWLKNE